MSSAHGGLTLKSQNACHYQSYHYQHLYKQNGEMARQEYKGGLKRKICIYSTYSPLSSTHLWLHCSNFFNPFKKNSLVVLQIRK
jgi:hypothetical protein